LRGFEGYPEIYFFPERNSLRDLRPSSVCRSEKVTAIRVCDESVAESEEEKSVCQVLRVEREFWASIIGIYMMHNLKP